MNFLTLYIFASVFFLIVYTFYIDEKRAERFIWLGLYLSVVTVMPLLWGTSMGRVLLTGYMLVLYTHWYVGTKTDWVTIDE